MTAIYAEKLSVEYRNESQFGYRIPHDLVLEFPSVGWAVHRSLICLKYVG